MTVNSWTDVGVAVAAIGTLVNTLAQQWGLGLDSLDQYQNLALTLAPI